MSEPRITDILDRRDYALFLLQEIAELAPVAKLIVDDPFVELDAGQARELADALIKAADVIEGHAGGDAP